MPAKILVADDDPDTRFMTAFTLRTLGGYEVIEARNGQEALDLSIEHGPAVLILDVQMPQLNGYDVCRQVRAHQRLAETAIILLSARDQASASRQGVEAGASLYMLKPYAPEHLVATVDRLIAV